MVSNSTLSLPHQVYKQKMKHLLCEHQNSICELEAAAVTSTEVMKTEQENKEAKLLQDLRTLTLDVEELHADLVFKHQELVSVSFHTCDLWA